ncbi:MAG: type II secretion system F family protein [Thermoleophilia bacterium]
MTRGSSLLALAAALCVVLAPAGAHAQSGVDLRVNEATKWPDRQLVLSLPAKRVLSKDQIAILEQGEPVHNPKIVSESRNRKRGVVLAIDASLTMRGEPIRQAMIAARSFSRRRSANTPLGVIFFSGPNRIALRPTIDRSRIKTTLAVGPALSRGTKIYDAAAASIGALREAGLTSGAVIVLSDGAEAQRGSAIAPAALTSLARRSNIRIFSVGLKSRSFSAAPLRKMAAATGGRYGQAARPQDLPPLFAALGERLSAEYVVNYRSTQPAGASVQVEALVDGFLGAASVGYRAPELPMIGVKPRFEANASSGLDVSRVVILAVSFFLVTAVVLFLLMRPMRRSVVARVTDFAGLPGAAPPTPTSARRRRRQREPSDRWRRYAEAIELSGIGLTPAALALWTAIGTVVFAMYLGFGIDRPPLMILAVAVPLAVRSFVLSRLNARRRQFEDQLPDNLQVLASALRAGYSFSAGIASMADDAPEPSRSELRRASNDEQLGMDVEEALATVGKRMDSAEIEYVGIVARMQREAGGNTAEVLDQVIETIRARQQLKRMVRTLTAQGRFGGIIISASPVVLSVGMSILNPGYFDPMFDSVLGIALLFGGVVMLTCGWLIIRKIVNVEP